MMLVPQGTATIHTMRTHCNPGLVNRSPGNIKLPAPFRPSKQLTCRTHRHMTPSPPCGLCAYSAHVTTPESCSQKPPDGIPHPLPACPNVCCSQQQETQAHTASAMPIVARCVWGARGHLQICRHSLAGSKTHLTQSHTSSTCQRLGMCQQGRTQQQQQIRVSIVASKRLQHPSGQRGFNCRRDAQEVRSW